MHTQLTDKQRRPHIMRIRWARRRDKYGGDHKATCTCCGLESNWHTTPERARTGLLQNHGVSA